MSSTRTLVTIEKLVYGGEGLGRVDGQVVLVPYVLPGERAFTTTHRAKAGLLRGKAPEIVEASPSRVTPRCEYFGSCGGCQYQHIDYAVQLSQKVEILRETLRRIGAISYEGGIPAIAADPWFYRNRIQLHFAGGESGFLRAGSHALQPVDHCYISSPVLVEAIARIREAVKRREWPAFLRTLELFTNGTEIQLNVLESSRPLAARFFTWCATFLPSLVPGPIDYTAAGFQFRISGGSFFQVNRHLVEPLVNEVLADASGDYAVDLYAGVGLFSLPLSKAFVRVDAIERANSAARDLEHNSAAAANLRSIRGSAESHLASLAGAKIDFVVVDPPRAGLGRETTEAILQVRPESLVVVSCDPATLARDLRPLLHAYEIERLTLVDLFPQTFHFETIARLSLK